MAARRMAARPCPHRLSVERLRLHADAGAGDDAVGVAGRPLGADARRLRHLRRAGGPRAGDRPARRGGWRLRRRSRRRSSPRMSASARSASPAPSDAASPASALRIVQPASTQSEKWQAENERRDRRALPDAQRRRDVARHRPRRRRPILIWPESAFPFLLTERPERSSAIADAPADGHDADHRRGARRRAGRRAATRGLQQRPTSSTTTARSLDAYDKVHLVRSASICPSAPLFDAARPPPADRACPAASRPAPRRRTLALPGAPAVRAADLLRGHLSRRGRRRPASARAGCSTSPTTPGSAIRPGPHQHLLPGAPARRRGGPAAGPRGQHRHLGDRRSPMAGSSQASASATQELSMATLPAGLRPTLYTRFGD